MNTKFTIISSVAGVRDARQTRGSVLILIVVLLVLLALMGTAFLTTTRNDRFSSKQHQKNTQSELADDGVRKIVQSLVGAQPGFTASPLPTPPATSAMPADYRNGLYLASRHPVVVGTAPNQIPVWSSICYPLNATWATRQSTPFVSPFGTTGASAFLTNANKDAYRFAPDTVTVTVNGVPTPYPALRLVNAAGADVLWDGTTAGIAKFIAADTDGDGIPDAGYFPLNVTFEGITYFAAVRLIDNNSAINVNTAWSQADFTMTGALLANPNQGLFLSATGLTELLSTYPASPNTPPMDQGAESQRLGKYRWGTNTWGTNQQSGITGQTGVIQYPFDDSNTPAARTDFVFTSQGDALSSQLGRRIDNLGYNHAATGAFRYQAYSLADQFNLTYPFAIRTPGVSLTQVEQSLMESLYGTAITTPTVRTTPYARTASDVLDWYRDNFDWGNELSGPVVNRPRAALRSYFVTHNPVSNHVVVPSSTGLPWPVGMPAYPTAPQMTVKADANTSSFEELWRAYWNVMTDPASPTQAPRTPGAAMFANPLRSATVLTSQQTVLLRSAIAAANTVSLRAGGDDISTDTIPSFSVQLDNSGSPVASVYGLERQPYITRCIVQRGATALNDYIAIELYNPNPAPTTGTSTITLGNNYIFGILDRTTMTFGGTTYVIPGSPTIAADARIILWDSAGGTQPGDVTLPGTAIRIPGMASAIGQELVLLRTRNATTYGSGTMPPANLAYNEGSAAVPSPANMIPLDQIDLRPAVNASGGVTMVRRTYARPSGGADAWKCVFAGTYTNGTGTAFTATNDPGTTIADMGTAKSAHDPAIATDFAIETNAFGHVGPNPYVGVVAPYRFPFGAFARNGDLLQVPFIGSYRITNTTGATLLEMNSVSIDAVKAVDTPLVATQQVGRFWPVAGANYDWCKQLFNYVTVQSPQHDFLPNVAPTASVYTADAYATAPQTVANGPVTSVAQANGNNEWMTGVNGLININTASWKTLSMLPLVMNAAGQVDNVSPSFNNDAMAKAIVTDRDANGPFASIFDLNRVPGFQNPAGLADTALFGELMPTGGNAAFRTNALQITRLSNLVTTNSDSFTCYILVQGWRNAGTLNATLETQYRAAYYIDRANSIPGTTSRTPNMIPIPVP